MEQIFSWDMLSGLLVPLFALFATVFVLSYGPASLWRWFKSLVEDRSQE